MLNWHDEAIVGDKSEVAFSLCGQYSNRSARPRLGKPVRFSREFSTVLAVTSHLSATGAVPESGASAVWVHISPRMALESGWAWVWL
jgi:hypothetical protein